jgi:hypothetical protein
MDGDIVVNVISFYCTLTSGCFDEGLVMMTVDKMLINYFFSCKRLEGESYNTV